MEALAEVMVVVVMEVVAHAIVTGEMVSVMDPAEVLRKGLFCPDRQRSFFCYMPPCQRKLLQTFCYGEQRMYHGP